MIWILKYLFLSLWIPSSQFFFYKLKTWHETEIECHDSLSNQSSSIFKVEIGIFFTTISFLVSFLSTHQKIIDLNQDDHHYITWQLSKKHQSLQKKWHRLDMYRIFTTWPNRRRKRFSWPFGTLFCCSQQIFCVFQSSSCLRI